LNHIFGKELEIEYFLNGINCSDDHYAQLQGSIKLITYAQNFKRNESWLGLFITQELLNDYIFMIKTYENLETVSETLFHLLVYCKFDEALVESKLCVLKFCLKTFVDIFKKVEIEKLHEYYVYFEKFMHVANGLLYTGAYRKIGIIFFITIKENFEKCFNHIIDKLDSREEIHKLLENSYSRQFELKNCFEHFNLLRRNLNYSTGFGSVSLEFVENYIVLIKKGRLALKVLSFL